VIFFLKLLRSFGLAIQFTFGSMVLSQKAFAHGAIPGADGFYSGLLHPLFVPAHLLLLVVVGLFLIQKNGREVQLALTAYALCLVCGLILAGLNIGGEIETLLLGLTAVIGLIVAATPGGHLYLSVCILAGAGFGLGLDSKQATFQGSALFAALCGSGIALSFLLIYSVAILNFYKSTAWQKIAVRVLGSWIAASALLVLALRLAPVTS